MNDAYDRVLSLDTPRWARLLSWPAAFVSFVAGVAIVARVTPHAHAHLPLLVASLDQSVDVEPPPSPPPPPPEPPTTAPTPEPRATPAPVARVAVDKPTPTTAPDENPLAQAARTLTTDEDDPSASTMVQGDGESFGGGLSGADGVAGHGPGGRGGGAPPPPPPPPPEPDLSRKATCSIQTDWGCEYPNGSIGEALVQIRLEIGPTGDVLNAAVVADPGPRYRAEALACAFRQHCEAPRNRAGQPTSGWTKPITIRFMPH